MESKVGEKVPGETAGRGLGHRPLARAGSNANVEERRRPFRHDVDSEEARGAWADHPFERFERRFAGLFRSEPAVRDEAVAVDSLEIDDGGIRGSERREGPFHRS